jgi:hypothetical protein
MITSYSLTPEWLALKRKTHKKSDPSIMERVIFALHLLEEIAKTDLKFVFKGGTSLLLLMDEPARFSVDIDIIVPKNTTREIIEELLSGVIENSIFKRMALDERRSYNGEIPKAHYKFIYDSHAINKEQEILLDILFEENSYPKLIQRPITCEWTNHEGDPILVTTPDINAITGDKLTAFAPQTIGVPYGKEKEKEIIKQLFDVGTLFDLVDDIETLKESFISIANKELSYKVTRQITIEDVFKDIFETGIILAKRDSIVDEVSKTNLKELQTGITQFGNYVYKGHFRIEDAQLASAKAVYLSTMIKTNYSGTIEKFNKKEPKIIIEHREYQFLNKKLKFVHEGAALFYWNKSLELLFR